MEVIQGREVAKIAVGGDRGVLSCYPVVEFVLYNPGPPRSFRGSVSKAEIGSKGCNVSKDLKSLLLAGVCGSEHFARVLLQEGVPEPGERVNTF